jgi:hexosaminidase
MARASLLSIVLVLPAVTGAACADDGDGDEGAPRDSASSSSTSTTTVEPLRGGSYDALIPRPVEVEPAAGELLLTEDTAIVVGQDAEAEGAMAAAELLRSYLAPRTGFDLPVRLEGGDPESSGPVIALRLDDRVDLGDEGYRLAVASDGIELTAAAVDGLRWGVQTIRQLLPAQIEGGGVEHRPWAVPAGRVEDGPRFGWRGAMLDVVRHFFPPEDVERVIDLLAAYKLNRLHLHLSDDQGWRLAIERYPELTEIGAATETGGGPGGFYTQDEYRGLVDYAADRGITVVPEIDLPGHTAAALASLPWLGCDGRGWEVATEYSSGQSSLCIDDERTYEFLENVVGEIAELTPGPYIHLGGDEAFATDAEAYRRFMERATEIVRDAGKQPMGWDELGTTQVDGETVVQHWHSPDNTLAGAEQGARVVLSPAEHAYLDMKYDDSTELGLVWAGFTDTRDAYEWEPANVVPGLAPEAILGLEAPLWTETVTTVEEIELMLLPRLPGLAELAWSPPEGRSWDEYRQRLPAHAHRWTAAGRAYTPDPEVPWP